MNCFLRRVMFLVFSLLLIGCGPSVQDFQSKSGDVALALTPALGPAFLARRQVTVYIAEEKSPCSFETLGAVRPAELPKTIMVEAGKTYNLRAIFQVASKQVHSQLVSDHLFKPSGGSSYELVLTQSKVGHAVRLFQNGQKIPFARPCLTNSNYSKSITPRQGTGFHPLSRPV